MMTHYEEMLKKWCDELLRLQVRGYGAPHDGGFLCPACTAIHGRADNAILPLAYCHALALRGEITDTAPERYLDAVRALLRFQERLTLSNGALLNDINNSWTGITVFSEMIFYRVLHCFGDTLPADIAECLRARIERMGQWVHENIVEGFHTNINYYCAAAACNAMTGRLFELPEHTAQARKLLAYCMAHFTENGLLVGEGYPHDEVTARGCRPIDIGYDMEESVPCLVEAAEILGDEETLKLLASYAKKATAFLLPDGGWDNSFGARNNKWTYYGSRTSDGAAASLLRLSRFEPALREAAVWNLSCIEACTKDGMLYGGRDYVKLGQLPCVHHLICHGAGIAEALLAERECGCPDKGTDLVKTEHMGMENSLLERECADREAPGEHEELCGVTYYPELDTRIVRTEKLRATVTGYDYRTYTWTNGAAHAGGGTMSLLYHRDHGIVIGGSTYEYKLTEPLNMQYPMGERAHRPLILRAELTSGGRTYATCLDPESVIRNEEMSFYVDAHFVDISGERFWNKQKKTATKNGNIETDSEPVAHFMYEFSDDTVTIRYSLDGELPEDTEVRFILPVRECTMTVEADAPCRSSKIFWLAGGFAADEYVFEAREVTVSLR